MWPANCSLRLIGCERAQQGPLNKKEEQLLHSGVLSRSLTIRSMSAIGIYHQSSVSVYDYIRSTRTI
jgi:hypothetical protein